MKMKRSSVVLRSIVSISTEIRVKKAQLGTLLLEASDKSYYTDWGFKTFASWLTKSGLGIAEREAQYLMNIARKAAEVGVTPAILDQFPTSYLKAIFTLDPEENAEEIKELLIHAKKKGVSLSDVKEAVGEITGKQFPLVYSVYFRQKKGKTVVERAVAKARKGEGVGSNGEALTLICTRFLKESAL